MKSKTKPDELLSTEDAASIAQRNAKTIVRWFDAGLISGEVVPLGGGRKIRRVSLSSLMSYLSQKVVAKS